MTSKAKEAGGFVKGKIAWLYARREHSAGKADLARLRRGIGKAPGSVPELWQATLEGLPESLLSLNDKPSYGEWAVHTALTLYALHQQGGKEAGESCMSREGMSLGRAVRSLIEPDRGNEPAVKRRFDAAVTADSFFEVVHHLRGLIQLMKSKDIGLDYPALTEELYRFHFVDQRDSMRLRWGQDFYRVWKEEKSGNDA
jgi:CRISPR system Cascade subunit CasB